MILFVTKNSDTFNNPTLYSILSVLEGRKIKSVLVCTSNSFSSPFTYNKVIYFNDRFPKKRKNLFKYFWSIVSYSLSHYLLYVYKFKVTSIIGIDPDGIIWADSIQKKYMKGLPIDYFSFEIFFKDENIDKQKEIEACRNIRNLVIQDSLRKELLFRENLLSETIKIFYIPVSILSDTSSELKKSKQSFREKHNISTNTKMIISFGSVAVWSGANIILELLNNDILPEDFVFVIHSRFPLSITNPIHEKLIAYSKINHNLILSTDYIGSFTDSVDFLKEFDYGFAFYISDGQKYTGKNIHNIGLSSGKFSMYMRAGLPTITNDLPTYKRLNMQFNFGFTVSDISDFSRLRGITTEDYQNYRFNCSELFDNLLKPTESIHNYIKAIM